MKTTRMGVCVRKRTARLGACGRPIASCLAMVCLALVGLGAVQAAPHRAYFEPASTVVIGEPLITGIYVEETNLVVTAQVPAGYMRVTLEGCERMGGAAWIPRAVARPGGQSGQVTFRLAAGPGLEILRLRADATDPLPAFFYTGDTDFKGQPVPNSGGIYLAGDSRAWTFDTAGPLTPLTGVEASGPTPPRAVVESDIWKVHGDTLYFFNQLRGLQVIDIHQPDQPVVTGTLSLAGAGDQMYLLDDTHVVLLARDNCGTSTESRAMVVEIVAGVPMKVASISISGTISESRLVGSALYVASRVYRYATATNSNGLVWESGTLVTSYDLSQPRHPLARSSEWIAGGYSAVVAATDRFLFVAKETEDYSASLISVFDISAPDGSMHRASTVRSAGRVKDKFKMNLVDDVLSVVSEQQSTTTIVETFSLANPAAPQKLGYLKIISGETLYATRFDGDRLYVVTFRRIDPLWLVDLSDPRAPRITGELQIPGYSTYLAPMGDRLLAIGRDETGGSKTIVSLFDVGDPAKPGLLKRVDLGVSYSHSEANEDEKAFGVFPEAGLILVPFSAYTTNGYIQAVQLIDLQRDALALRGQIQHALQPRRATPHRDRILSLSGRELLTVDATDRDHPVVRNVTTLSWPVDQVFLSGDYLIELGRADAGGTVVRIAPTGAPDNILADLVLTNLPFMGAAHKEGRLYVAQGKPAEIRYNWDPVNQTNRPLSTNWGVLSLTVLDTSQLPRLTALGWFLAPTDQPHSGEWKALWPKPSLLVWALDRGTYYYALPVIRFNPLTPLDVMLPVNPGGVISFRTDFFVIDSAQPAGLTIWGGPWWGDWYWYHGWGGPQRFLAFDVADPRAPTLVSDVQLDTSDNRGGSAEAFATNNLVYTGHRQYESLVTGTNYWLVTNTVSQLVTNLVTVTNIVSTPHYSWTTNIEPLTNITITMVLSRPAGFDSWQPPSLPIQGILSCGGAHSLLVSPQNQLLAWGGNSMGQLGSGSYSAGTDQLLQVAGLPGIRSAAAGQWHTLALDESGSIWAWGYGFHGQLGGGEPATNWPPIPYLGSPTPARVPGLENAVSIAAGFSHSLAVAADGSVWQWGADWTDLNTDGAPQYVPKVVPGLAGVRSVAAGYDHSLALAADGRVWAWGRNGSGQLGSSAGPARSPMPVPSLPKIGAVAAGLWYSLALAEDGTVWGWGFNQAGVLGNNSLPGTTFVPPGPILGLGNVVAISAGRDHGLALKQDGSLWTWGSNERGQLGGQSVTSSAVPVRVAACSNVVSIAAGRWFSLALSSRGELWAWGSETDGQLGSGVRQVVTNDVFRTNVIQVVTYTYETNVTQEPRVQRVYQKVVTTNSSPIVITVVKDYLDVIDYSVPTYPVARPAVSVPGLLRGISHGGALLYTVGSKQSNPNVWNGLEWLDALAYDGVAAHLVDSLPLTNSWSSPALVQEGAVYVGRAGSGTNVPPRVEAWTLPSGKFVKSAEAELPGNPQALAGFGGLLAVQTGYDLKLFDVQVPGALKSLAEGGPGSCAGFNLEKADGSVERGLWLPLGDMGVMRVGP